MFGKGITKIIGLAIAGAIALAAGAELLSSVVSVVLAFRFGNYLPLTMVVALTLSITIISNRYDEESPTHTLLKILSYASTGYLVVVSFVIALPYGLVIAIIAAGSAGVGISIIGDQKKIGQQVGHFFMNSQASHRFSGTSLRTIQLGDGTSYTLKTFHSLLILERSSRDKLIQLMRNRPRLPISLTIFEDCDVLFIVEDDEPLRFDRILKLLKDSSIETKGLASPLLAEAIQMVPVIDSKNGLDYHDYRIATDDKTIDDLLSLAPPRMTIFPSQRGLRVLVPEMEAPGLNVERIKSGYEMDVLLHREFSNLEEAEKPIENTT